MNDTYMEYILKKKKNGAEVLLTATIIFGAILLTAILFVLMIATARYGQITSTIGLLLAIGVWYGARYLINKQNVEYEYILTNSEIDMDKIMSKKSRKRLASFDFKEITVCANIKDDEHNYDYKNVIPKKLVNVIGDFERGNIYFADYVQDGETCRVLFQPTSRMMETVKKYNPRNVFITED